MISWRLPQQRLGSFARGRNVHPGEQREPAEGVSGILRGLAHHRNMQAATDYGGNLSRHGDLQSGDFGGRRPDQVAHQVATVRVGMTTR
jgi:hypothetical protein